MRNDRRDARTGIQTEERHWATVHAGTREALIAAGLAQACQFPGEPGCGKTSTIFPAGAGERKKQVRRRSSSIFEVVIYRTAAEEAAARAQDEAALRQALSTVQRDRYSEVLATEGAAGLRRVAQDSLMRGGQLIEAAFNIHDSPDIPYRFDQAVREEALAAICKLIQLMRRPLKVRAGALAGGDAEFQRFLGAVVQPRAPGAAESQGGAG